MLITQWEIAPHRTQSNKRVTFLMLFIIIYIHQILNSNTYYRPQKKLLEGDVFTGVCLFMYGVGSIKCIIGISHMLGYPTPSPLDIRPGT